MATEKVNLAKVRSTVEEILAKAEPGNYARLPIKGASYYPSESSSWHQDAKYIKTLIAEGYAIQDNCPFRGPASGTVTIRRAGPFYIASLELEELHEYAADLRYGNGLHLDLDDFNVPTSVLSPNIHLIEYARSYNPPIGSIYTVDLEGSRWSLHLDNPKSV